MIIRLMRLHLKEYLFSVVVKMLVSILYCNTNTLYSKSELFVFKGQCPQQGLLAKIFFKLDIVVYMLRVF